MENSNRKTIQENLVNSGFILDDATGVWRQDSDQEFAYSDGDEIENYLLEVVRNAQDRSVISEELRNAIKDWPSLYHLSRRRSNLLRPFEEELKGKKILEIGCGCGAITRYLGEIGAQVLALEGSPRRAQIARERCRDLDNITVACARSDEFGWEGYFDVILLIGVLEYSPKYLGKDGPDIMLTSVRKQMKADGFLILAIENQLGLKYFAGFREDHAGKAMYGINDSYREGEFRTWGRKELFDIIGRNGFEQIEQYIPLPDYKLPVSVITPLGWREYPEEMKSLAIESAMYDFQRTPFDLFSMEIVYDQIWINELGSDMANSFLLKMYQRHKKTGYKELAYYFSENRKIIAGKILKIIENKLGKLSIESNNIGRKSRSTNKNYITGKLYWLYLVKILNSPGWTIEEITSWTRKWIISLQKTIGEPLEINSIIKAKWWDATPFNAIEKDGGELFFIDLEKPNKNDIEFGFLLYRGIVHSLDRITNVEEPCQGNSDMNIFNIAFNVLKKINSNINNEKFEAWIKKDFLDMQELTGTETISFSKYRNALYLKKRESVEYIIRRTNHEKESLKNKIEEIQREKMLLTEELNKIYLSTSWKITDPIRKIMLFLKKG